MKQGIRARFWGLLLVTIWLASFAPAFGQFSIITKVTYQPQKTSDRLDFRMTAPVHVQKEYFPKTHAVLVKILGAAFNPEFSQDLIQTVKKCSLHPNVAQINDTSIFILFKGINASRVAVTQKPHLLQIRIRKTTLPTAYKANLHRGVLLVKQKKYRRALVYLRRALHAQPGDAAAYFWAGKARFALGDWRAARYNLEEAKKQSSFRTQAGQLLTFIRAKESEHQNRNVQTSVVVEKPKVAEQISKKIGAPTAGEQSPKRRNLAASNFSETKTKTKKAQVSAITSEAKTGRGAPLGQLLLFLSIVATAATLPFAFFLSRRPKRAKKLPGVSFEKNLEAFQLQQQRVLRQVEEAGRLMEPEKERPFQPLKPKATKKSAQQGASHGLNWREEPLLRNTYSESELVRKARKFASRGYTYDEIAQKLGVGKGELQLALSLAGEKIDLAQRPGLRLTFGDDDR